MAVMHPLRAVGCDGSRGLLTFRLGFGGVLLRLSRGCPQLVGAFAAVSSWRYQRSTAQE